MLGRQGQLLEKAALAYAQLTRSLRGAYAELTPILCSNPETKIASECLATNAVQHYGRQTVLLFSLLVTGMRYSMAVSIVYYRSVPKGGFSWLDLLMMWCPMQFNLQGSHAYASFNLELAAA